MLVVMPNGNPSKQAAPGETPDNLSYKPAMSDSFPCYKDGSYEKSFTKIIHFIDNRYRTIPDKRHRAIAGLISFNSHLCFSNKTVNREVRGLDKMTLCNLKARRIDFSGAIYISLANTQEKISNRLFNSVISKNRLSF